MLLTQARTEAERHETRRNAAEERFTELLRPYASQSGLGDSHQQLMLQAQRAALMSAQLEVLEGKQRVLRRYADGLGQQIEAMAGEAGPHDVVAGAGQAEGSTAASREVLAAQEDLRRAIARRMHDGPAQSIANIALQAQVAQRLLSRDPAAADRELDELRRIVQHALEATKDFIFEVSPMVLDDLGLLPTLRRAVRERAQRVGIAVALESHGADRRLGREIESNLFRIVDDAVAAYLANSPAEVLVRLEWADDQVAASIRATLPALPAEPPPPPEKPGRDLPPALAGMIADQAAGVVARAEAKRRAYGLPDTVWRELESRARTVDIALSLADDGLLLEACTQPPTVPIME
jgi:two-component system sensor histidine kinase DegS